MNRWPYNTVSFQLLVVGILLVIALIVATVSIAGAASLRICFAELPQSVATAPAFINNNPLWPDLLTGSVQGAGDRCNTIPIPATVVRGQDQTITMKATNALGEVSAASNGKTFSLPPNPPVPVINSVSLVAP